MSKKISKKLKIKFSKIFFYTSYSPNPKKLTKKAKKYLKNEAFFYKSVKKTPDIIFFKGYRSKTSGKEKEVDVKLAVDIVDLAHQNQYDQLCIMSGDADFMHALFIAKKLQKQIKITCIEGKIMHKATFYFNTTIFLFNKTNYRSHKGQKIKLFKLPKTLAIKIKNP
ncbi:NYN domain-containing protein [Patescibacteria group bacterium]|nr:NYN domain-containing protein [Patescibacteria group bacterium]